MKHIVLSFLTFAFCLCSPTVASAAADPFDSCTDGLYYGYLSGAPVVYAGVYCDSDENAYPCPAGYYCPTEPYAQPIKCPAGYYCTTDETLPYINGTVYSSNCDIYDGTCAYEPTPCPDGTYSTGGTTACTTCAKTPCDPTNGTEIVLETPCDIGISQIKTSAGLSVALYAEKYTEPSLAIGYNDGKCYGKLETGNATGTINFNYNGTIYHLVD